MSEELQTAVRKIINDRIGTTLTKALLKEALGEIGTAILHSSGLHDEHVEVHDLRIVTLKIT